MKSHNYKFGRRVNWRSIVLAMVFPICFTVSHYANLDNTYVAEQNVFMKPIVTEVIYECGISLEDVCLTGKGKIGKFSDKDIEDKIRSYFPKSHDTIIAIAYAESGMDMDAKGWNCYYNSKETIVYEQRVKGSHSTACKKEHRRFAWSVDCFALQRNYKGKECPSITVDEHLKEVAELSRKQGLQAWVTYNTGAYKKYLAQN